MIRARETKMFIPKSG